MADKQSSPASKGRWSGVTYDDGILKVYTVSNIAENGSKPKKGLTLKEEFYFSFDVLGINRYFTALEAKIQLEHIVNIPGWSVVSPLDICVLEDGTQYRIQMIQPLLDEDGLRMTKLSLERISENYEFASTGNDTGNNSGGVSNETTNDQNTSDGN